MILTAMLSAAVAGRQYLQSRKAVVRQRERQRIVMWELTGWSPTLDLFLNLVVFLAVYRIGMGLGL